MVEQLIMAVGALVVGSVAAYASKYAKSAKLRHEEELRERTKTATERVVKLIQKVHKLLIDSDEDLYFTSVFTCKKTTDSEKVTATQFILNMAKNFGRTKVMGFIEYISKYGGSSTTTLFSSLLLTQAMKDGGLGMWNLLDQTHNKEIISSYGLKLRELANEIEDSTEAVLASYDKCTTMVKACEKEWVVQHQSPALDNLNASSSINQCHNSHGHYYVNHKAVNNDASVKHVQATVPAPVRYGRAGMSIETNRTGQGNNMKRRKEKETQSRIHFSDNSKLAVNAICDQTQEYLTLEAIFFPFPSTELHQRRPITSDSGKTIARNFPPYPSAPGGRELHQLRPIMSDSGKTRAWDVIPSLPADTIWNQNKTVRSQSAENTLVPHPPAPGGKEHHPNVLLPKSDNTPTLALVMESKPLALSPPCLFCDEDNHIETQCWHRQKVRCNKCKLLGHKPKFCHLYFGAGPVQWPLCVYKSKKPTPTPV